MEKNLQGGEDSKGDKGVASMMGSLEDLKNQGNYFKEKSSPLEFFEKW